MRFFNIDMHISVIHDVQHIFRNLGHAIDRESLSGHNWVVGAEKPSISLPTRRNWRTIDQKMVDKFYRKYRERLSRYDGFVHSFPPAFALLFEKFEKPVITIACTRFDYPTMPGQFSWMVDGLRRMSSSGQLTMVANNLLDQVYVERFSGIRSSHISSLCDYMEVKKTETAHDKFLLWTRGGQRYHSERISESFSIERPYDRNVIKKHAGVVHLPYNLSIMSAFEHYWTNIPMYFPNENLQKLWFRSEPYALSEVLFPGSALFFDESFIKLADWYDSDNFSEVRLFEDFDDLERMLADDDPEELSGKMEQSNQIRKTKIYGQWESLLKQLR